MDYSILIVAFFLSALIHYGVQKLFIYNKRFDNFNHRSSHKTLATRTGGIGIFLTLLSISLYNYFRGIEIFDYSLFIPLGIMFIIGVYDDLYNADFKLKFFIQIIVAKILIDQGYVISNYHGLFGIYEVPWLLAQLSTVFVFLVVVNAINFIDGIDGLALTEVIKIIIVVEFFSNGITSLNTLGFIVISSIIPLYYYNFKKKRKVFLGDGGSMLLGVLIMIYILFTLGESYSFKPKLVSNKTLFVILILFYPLIDLLRVFILRIAKGHSPFKPDQNHIHHILLKKYDSPLKALIIIQFINLLFILILIL
tara:strand:+ start:67 stop:993 length:927 start_codon:yes stop_codon:yes gene_type:complete